MKFREVEYINNTLSPTKKPLKMLSIVDTEAFENLFEEAKTDNLNKKHLKIENIKLKICHFIESTFFQSIVLIMSSISLLSDDIKYLILPKSMDTSIKVIHNFLFFFFTSEFFLLCICHKKFINSFPFWRDILAILSLIPETHLIWHPVETALLSYQNPDDQIIVNQNDPATSISYKVTLYLKLIKLVNFMKIIRLSKLLGAQRIINYNRKKSRFGIRQFEELLKKIQKKRLKLKSKTQNDIEKAVKLLKEPQLIKIKKFSSPFPQNSPKKFTKSSLIIKESEDVKENEVKIKKFQSLFFQNNKNKLSKDLGELKINNFDSPINNLNPNNNVNFNYSYLYDEENPESFSFSNDDFSSRIVKKEESLINKLDRKDNSILGKNRKESEIPLKIINQDLDEKKRNDQSQENKSEISENDSEAEIKELTTENAIQNHKNFKLEKTLTETYLNKIIILLMILLIIIPLLQTNFLNELLVNPSFLMTSQKFCILALSRFKNASVSNKIYESGFHKLMDDCVKIQRNLIYLKYNNIKDNANESLLIQEKNDSYSNLINFREDIDYYNISYSPDKFSNFSAINFVKGENDIEHILSIIKVFLVGFVLLSIAYLLNHDVIYIVIFPLNNIFTLLQFHLKYIDEFIPQKEMTNRLKSMRPQEENKINDIIKKEMEIHYIQKQIQIIVKLVSSVIGKQMLMMLPHCNLNLPYFQFNHLTPCIQFKASFLTIKISNIDSLVKKMQNDTILFLNKIYDLYHKLGIIFSGDIVESGRTIIWKWNKTHYNKQLAIYSKNIMTNEKEFNPTHSEDDSSSIKSEYWDHNSNKAVLCAVKFCNLLIESELFHEIQSNKVEIILLTNEGNILSNYSYCVNKMYHILESNAILESREIMKNVPSFFSYPSLFISEESYRNLGNSIKQSILPFPIYDSDLEVKFIIYRQFLNTSRIEKKKFQSFQKILNYKVSDVIDEKLKFENQVKQNISLTDYIIKDIEIKLCFEDFRFEIKKLMTFAIKKILKGEYSVCLKVLKDLNEMNIKETDFPLHYHIEDLLNKIEKILSR